MMKGSDIIQIAASVFGIKWFDVLCAELGISEKELGDITKMEKIPGPVEYALRDMATKYMARVESMHVNSKFTDALVNAQVDDREVASFMAGMIKGMAVAMAAVHGEADELKTLAKEKDFIELVKAYMGGMN